MMEKGFQNILNRIMHLFMSIIFCLIISIWFCQKHWPSLELAYASISYTCTPTTTMEDLHGITGAIDFYVYSFLHMVGVSIKKSEQMQIHGKGIVRNFKKVFPKVE